MEDNIQNNINTGNLPNINKTSEIYEIDPKEVGVSKPGQIFDSFLYEGRKVKIAKIEIKKETDFYASGEYDANSTDTCFRLYVYTEPLKDLVLRENGDKDNPEDYTFSQNDLEYMDADGNPKKVIISARFNLVTNDKGKPAVLESPRAKLYKFLLKQGIMDLDISKLIGKYVLLDTQPDKDDPNRKYLRISIPQ